MATYRCDWCGRFYSSPLPEGSACPNHIAEWNDQLTDSIERHNRKLTRQERLQGLADRGCDTWEEYRGER
jgi:hypothetical protein